MIGRRIGVYEIVASLGAGGMGEVYRARDTALRRDVAIKFLPEALSENPDRVARLEREARALASISHPNVAAVFGLESYGDGLRDRRALVMELVEGETLADRLRRRRGPLPLGEAVDVARQIVEALDAAHTRGIVHRDLKPANVKVTPDGLVKVLDFGLAKSEPSRAAGDPDDAPTTTLMTEAGAVVGTPGYMSPEQARGQPVDRQTDIWSFGCVLYQMLSGAAPFVRDTIADTLAAIVSRDPDWTALPSATPPLVTRLLRRCLARDTKARLRDIADARVDLVDLGQPGAAVARPTRGRWLVIAGTAALSLAGGAIGAYALLGRATAHDALPPAVRLSVAGPGQVTPQTSVAVSPDGGRLAFVSTDASGRSMLWIRDLASLDPHVVPGTEDAAHPFWSPDGASLGFLAGGRLKRVDTADGRVLTLATVKTRSGGSWGRAGQILFVPTTGEIASVPAVGGDVTTVLQAPNGGSWPSFLPDGRHFLFFNGGSDGPRGVYLGTLGTADHRLIVETDYKAAYVDSGDLLFVRGDALLAQPFDLTRFVLTGDPTVVAEGIWRYSGAAQASFSATTGVLAYVNASLTRAQMTWFDRNGRPDGVIGRVSLGGTLHLSPDGTRLAGLDGETTSDVWIVATRDGAATRATFASNSVDELAWSGDGSRLFFTEAGRSATTFFARSAAAGAADDRVDVLDGYWHAWDWTGDGKMAVLGRLGAQGAADLWTLAVGSGHAVPFAQSAVHKTQAQIAPDGHWLAYTSYESGRDEVYVDSFPVAGRRRQISSEGGMQPRWRRDGSELYYLSADQWLMTVPTTMAGASFNAGRPAPLFRTHLIPEGSQSIWFNTLFDVGADGRRFVVEAPPDDPGPPLTVVLNWMSAVRR